ncbi:hypothetical protein TSAR_014715, partial [Trichomalopsis sarcophagae]
MEEVLAEKLQDLNLDKVRTKGNIRPTSANDKNGSEENNDALIRSHACFPRSEYKTRFQGSSAFVMSDSLYWGTYFRSTSPGGNCDRIARMQCNKVYDNFNINKPRCSDKTPWAFTEYNQIFDSEIKCKNIYKNNISSLLYDDLLRYKIYICRTVIDKFLARKRNQSKINVYFLNEFPCILVQIPEFAKHNIPIELMIRSSFGHNIPSVSETKTSFRINFGVVPECYAKDEINLHNQKVQKYFSLVEDWKANESARDLLCKNGDSSGRKVSYQITRQNCYVDLLADYAHQLCSDEIENLAKPLEEVLKKLIYDNKATLNNEENESIKNDIKFWDMIQKMSSVFTMLVDITDLINNKKIKGLYRLLEKANLEFVKNRANQCGQDGYGSSSDCEINFENTSFYSKKIIVNTGMRAINLALFLSMYQVVLNQKKISKAIKLFTTHKNVSALLADMNPYGTLRFIARTSDDVNKLYYAARICLQTLKERLPKQSHNIRKAYKDVGAVITNAAIYTRDEGFNYKPNAHHNDDILEYINTQSYESAYYYESALQKISLLFSPQLSNLKANFSPQ